MLTFDTYNLPGDAVISAASIRPHITGSSIGNGRICLVSSNHAFPPTDLNFPNVGNTYEDILSGGYTGVFNITDLSRLTKAGYTRLGIKHIADADNLDIPINNSFDFICSIYDNSIVELAARGAYDDPVEVVTEDTAVVWAWVYGLPGPCITVEYTSALEDPDTVRPNYYFEYATDYGGPWTPTPLTGGDAYSAKHFATLTGLTPNTFYYYRMVGVGLDDSEFRTGIRYFTTLAASQPPLTAQHNRVSAIVRRWKSGTFNQEVVTGGLGFFSSPVGTGQPKKYIDNRPQYTLTQSDMDIWIRGTSLDVIISLFGHFPTFDEWAAFVYSGRK
jgi:hypothetical protein